MQKQRAAPPKGLKSVIMLSLLLVVALWPGLAQAVAPEASFPSPMGLVNDFANVLDDASEQAIGQVAADLWQNKGIELAVVTIGSTDPLDINTYAYQLFQQWGIGEQKQNNGVLVLLNTGARQVRIEVGLGLEGDLNDAKVGRILDLALPDLKVDKFGSGLLTISQQLQAAVANVDGQGKSLGQQLPQVTGVAIFGGGYLLLLIFAIIFRQNWLLFLLLRLPMMFIRGGGGRGGGGGGFGGFGGGRSGGGGAGRDF